MVTASLASKLRLKPGQRAGLINAPQGYAESLGPLPDGVALVEKLSGKFDWLQIFAQRKADLGKLAPRAAKTLKPESLLWIAFPKGSSKIQTDLTRDKGWDGVRGLDLTWINLVSVNDTWSAFSLRPYKPGEARQSFR